MRIAKRINLSFLVLALVLGGVSAAIFYGVSRSNLKEAICDHLNTTARSRANHIEAFLADRKASVRDADVEERVRAQVQTVFGQGSGVERCFFPTPANHVPDRPALRLVVLPPERCLQAPDTLSWIELLLQQALHVAPRPAAAVADCSRFVVFRPVRVVLSAVDPVAYG